MAARRSIGLLVFPRDDAIESGVTSAIARGDETFFHADEPRRAEARTVEAMRREFGVVIRNRSSTGPGRAGRLPAYVETPSPTFGDWSYAIAGTTGPRGEGWRAGADGHVCRAVEGAAAGGVAGYARRGPEDVAK
jgi:hypothetical protein